MEDAYAALGRKQLELENLNAEYDRVLLLLSQVVSGQTAKEAVTIDLTGRKWTLTAAEPKPEEN